VLLLVLKGTIKITRGFESFLHNKHFTGRAQLSQEVTMNEFLKRFYAQPKDLNNLQKAFTKYGFSQADVDHLMVTLTDAPEALEDLLGWMMRGSLLRALHQQNKRKPGNKQCLKNQNL
jgi:hypothetical protein